MLADVGWQLPVPSSRREALTAESLCTWPCWVVSTCMRKNRRKTGMRVMRAQSDVEHFISKRPGNISIAKTAAVYIWECVPQNTRLYKCPFSPASSVDPRTSEISMQNTRKHIRPKGRGAMGCRKTLSDDASKSKSVASLPALPAKSRSVIVLTAAVRTVQSTKDAKTCGHHSHSICL